MESIQYKKAKDIYAFTSSLMYDQKKDRSAVIAILMQKGIDCDSALAIVNYIEKEDRSNSAETNAELFEDFFELCNGLWAIFCED